MTDLSTHPFAPCNVAAESGDSPRTMGWLRWCDAAERLLGHDIDGNDTGDNACGYSIDEAHTFWNRGHTADHYVAVVLERDRYQLHRFEIEHPDLSYGGVQGMAAEMAGAFEERKRPDGTGYFALKANHPGWMRDVCMAAHAGQLPNDYRYRFILAALQALEDGTDIEHIDSAIDNAVGTYNSQLADWLASHGDRFGYVDEAAQELGLPANTDLWGRLREGQRAEIAEVFAIVQRELEERATA